MADMIFSMTEALELPNDDPETLPKLREFRNRIALAIGHAN